MVSFYAFYSSQMQSYLKSSITMSRPLIFEFVDSTAQYFPPPKQSDSKYSLSQLVHSQKTYLGLKLSRLAKFFSIFVKSSKKSMARSEEEVNQKSRSTTSCSGITNSAMMLI